MATDPDQLVTVTEEGNALVVTIHGELDLTVAPRLQATLSGLVEAGHAVLVLDLSELSFIDSTGLSILVRTHQATSERGGRLALRRPRPVSRKVLETTGLDHLLEIEPD